MSTEFSGTIGIIEDVRRYPVKSMLGESVMSAQVIRNGLLGDRAYAVIDCGTGRVASAKEPRKWGRLLELQAGFDQEPQSERALPAVRVRLPNGDWVVTGDSETDRLLSELLGRDVTLTHERPESPSVERLDPFSPEETIVDIGALMMSGRFSDYAALHIVTTSSLRHLARIHPEGDAAVRRFRPNLVVKTELQDPGFAENGWVGGILAIGDEVRLRISDPSPRCSIPTLRHGDSARDPKLLGVLATHNTVSIPVLEGARLPSFGVYAFVIQAGRIRQGDPVRLF